MKRLGLSMGLASGFCDNLNTGSIDYVGRKGGG